MLPAANIIEKMIKTAVLVSLEGFTPLYDENLTMVESNIIIDVKTKINASEVFLLRIKLP
jgi:hypothetical protein